jgi:hypothetical protein
LPESCQRFWFKTLKPREGVVFVLLAVRTELAAEMQTYS